MTIPENEIRRARIYADMRAIARLQLSYIRASIFSLRDLMLQVPPEQRENAFETMVQAIEDAITAEKASEKYIP